MYKAPKDQIAQMPEQLDGIGSTSEAMSLLSMENPLQQLGEGGTSLHEQLKRTPRKAFR